MVPAAVQLDAIAETVISAAAREASPLETGGLLLGYFDAANVVVTSAIEVKDPNATTRSYAREYRRAQDALGTALSRMASEVGYVGDWHSHPGSAFASDQDKIELTKAATELRLPLAMIVASVRKGEVTLSSYVFDEKATRRVSHRSTTPVVEVAIDEQQSRGSRRDGGETKMTDDELTKGAKRKVPGETWYFISAGMALLALTWGGIVKGSDAAAASLAILGGGALILAPFAPHIEGTLKMGALEMSIRQRLIGAAVKTSEDNLEGVLALLESEDIGVEQISLPSGYTGKTLTSPELQHVRQDLKLSVIAIRRPGEPLWVAGGQISDEPLPDGTTLLVAGPPESLRAFRLE
jgi:proteasome lid subunit RPN8/RPN11